MRQLLHLLLMGIGFMFAGLVVSTALMLPLGNGLPKSDRLAFMGSVHENLDIFVADVSRSLIVRFTRSEAWERYPAWSPDGEFIAYHSGPPRQPGCTINYEIFISSLDGRSVRQITGSNLDDFQTFDNTFSETVRCAAMPDWSPDGQKLAFHANPAGQWDIFVYDLVSDELTQVTDGPDDDVLFDWAADGQSGVFASGIGTMMTLNWINVETGVVDPLTSIASVLDTNGFVMTPTGTLEDWHPTLSPDGTQIVFMSNRSGAQDIYVMNADGSNIRNVTNDSYTDTNPVWTGDGNIIFTSDRAGITRLFSVRPNGDDLSMLMGWRFDEMTDGAAWWSPSLDSTAASAN